MSSHSSSIKSIAAVTPSPIIPLVLLQLFSYGGNALAKPYVNLYFVSIGISASFIGILLSVGALLEMVLPPALNLLADRTGRHRRLYIAFISVMILANMMLLVKNAVWVLALAAVLYEAAFRPTLTLGMQLLISKMEHEGRAIVGRIRSFSSLGYGLSSILASWFFMVGGYASLFISGASAYFMAIAFSSSLPEKTAEPANDRKLIRPRTRGFYVIAISLFFLMMGNRAGYSFWFVHFNENVGLSTVEIGYMSALMALIEIPFFILLDGVMKRVDVRIVFLVGAIGMSLIWFAVGFVPSRIWIYPLLLARGITFSVFYLSTFMLVNRVSVPENVATNQAIAQGTLPSLAALLTGSLAGWSYEFIGASMMFTACAIVSLIGVVIAIAGYHTLQEPTPTTASS